MPLRQVFRQGYVQEERKEHKREENVARESLGKAKLRRWGKVPVLENDTVPAPVVLNSDGLITAPGFLSVYLPTLTT